MFFTIICSFNIIKMNLKNQTRRNIKCSVKQQLQISKQADALLKYKVLIF